jgi:hypothetical protein|tara:strand:+ start:499 stop:831 length:333 start_codon:yes stop_codon:yes gene_type:complete
MTIYTIQGKLEREFWEFHVAHPEVYRYLVTFARQWLHSGNRVCGIAMLFERVRWEMGIVSETDPKVNNNHRAFYARLIMEREPDLAGMFRLRQQRAQATIGPDTYMEGAI